MKTKTIYCDECLEDIPNAEVYWEEDRLYCGRCASELDTSREDKDLLDDFARRKPARWQAADDDVDLEDDLDEDDDADEEDADWNPEEEEAADPEENGGAGKPGRRRK
jgi:hypothetical protein